jgi:hypothetical protein
MGGIRETEGEKGDRRIGFILSVKENTATLLERVTEDTTLLLCLSKIFFRHGSLSSAL